MTAQGWTLSSSHRVRGSSKSERGWRRLGCVEPVKAVRCRAEYKREPVALALRCRIRAHSSEEGDVARDSTFAFACLLHRILPTAKEQRPANFTRPRPKSPASQGEYATQFA